MNTNFLVHRNIGFKGFAVLQPSSDSNKYRLADEIVQRCKNEQRAEVDVFEKSDSDEVMVYHPNETIFQNDIRPVIINSNGYNIKFGAEGKDKILLENWKKMGA